MVVLKPSSDDTLSFDDALARVVSAYKSIIVGDVFLNIQSRRQSRITVKVIVLPTNGTSSTN